MASALPYVSIKIGDRNQLFHRLVADAFDLPGKSETVCCVNHKNGDPTDNSLTNLEWVTPSENMKHSYATNKHRRSSAPSQSYPVAARLKGTDNDWMHFESINAAARELRLSHRHITECAGNLASRRRISQDPTNENATT